MTLDSLPDKEAIKRIHTVEEATPHIDAVARLTTPQHARVAQLGDRCIGGLGLPGFKKDIKILNKLQDNLDTYLRLHGARPEDQKDENIVKIKDQIKSVKTEISRHKEEQAADEVMQSFFEIQGKPTEAEKKQAFEKFKKQFLELDKSHINEKIFKNEKANQRQSMVYWACHISDPEYKIKVLQFLKEHDAKFEPEEINPIKRAIYRVGKPPPPFVPIEFAKQQKDLVLLKFLVPEEDVKGFEKELEEQQLAAKIMEPLLTVQQQSSTEAEKKQAFANFTEQFSKLDKTRINEQIFINEKRTQKQSIAYWACNIPDPAYRLKVIKFLKTQGVKFEPEKINMLGPESPKEKPADFNPIEFAKKQISLATKEKDNPALVKDNIDLLEEFSPGTSKAYLEELVAEAERRRTVQVTFKDDTTGPVKIAPSGNIVLNKIPDHIAMLQPLLINNEHRNGVIHIKGTGPELLEFGDPEEAHRTRYRGTVEGALTGGLKFERCRLKETRSLSRFGAASFPRIKSLEFVGCDLQIEHAAKGKTSLEALKTMLEDRSNYRGLNKIVFKDCTDHGKPLEITPEFRKWCADRKIDVEPK